LERMRNAVDVLDPSLDAFITRGIKHLQGFQGAAWARRFEERVRSVRSREQALSNGDASLPLTNNAARSLLKLMSYKDEYEVARLYTDGAFVKQLQAQFEGDVKLEFHMAPPIVARGRNGQAPAKIRLGAWMLPAMRLLARGKALRGSMFDPFGYTQERRLERELIEQFDARLVELTAHLDAANQAVAAQIAAVPMSIRGYGHVKTANWALAKARESELLHRFDPKRYPKPVVQATAGQFRGISIVAS
jgi:indolepyruvate ferredoxin oxidoreductase